MLGALTRLGQLVMASPWWCRCGWLTSWLTTLKALMLWCLAGGLGRGRCGLGWRLFLTMLMWWCVMTLLGRGLRLGCLRA